jgi:hypothetical protein
MAGAVASGFITPFDVIKTRLQVKGGAEKYVNIATCFNTVVKEEGYGALFKVIYLIFIFIFIAI